MYMGEGYQSYNAGTELKRKKSGIGKTSVDVRGGGGGQSRHIVIITGIRGGGAPVVRKGLLRGIRAQE